MGLKPGTKMTDIELDVVWIGSCTNGRIEDLRNVAKVVEGKKIAGNLAYAMIVPGSGLVKEQAEAEGLRQDLQGRRLRMARTRLLHVPRHEPGPAEARPALRLDLQPQLRRPPGLQGPHPPALARDGRSGSTGRPLRGRAQARPDTAMSPDGPAAAGICNVRMHFTNAICADSPGQSFA